MPSAHLVGNCYAVTLTDEGTVGLTIIVGDLAELLEEEEIDEEEIEHEKEIFRSLDRFLRRCGLPGHEEPESLPELPYRGEEIGFPYSCLHYLRRAFVYLKKNLPVRPCEFDRATSDPILEDEYNSPSIISHLIHHSDCEGFYFPQPLVAPEEDDVRGQTVGSSYGLLRELIELAPPLGISLSNGDLDEDGLKELVYDQHRAEHPLGTERMVWFTLFEAARKSIKYKTAIRLG
jgi:hypothetical protein